MKTKTKKPAAKRYSGIERVTKPSLRDLLGLPELKANGCRWFARCDREAVTLVPHPILGDVPCCERCATFATGGR